MNKKVTGLLLVFLLAQVAGTFVYATELMNKFAVRIHIVENGTIYEWEFDNPDKYEFEKGNTIVRGNEAKEKVDEIIALIKLKEDANVEDMVEKLLVKYPQLERFDARLMNGEGKLFTWIWEKEEKTD
ncbi:hypothetical protein [Bacillus sp. FJAT-45350]|uniref:hypothetical protein n=1 Tax=Bacillus sp. FJAT-45350 TaxID=2011014 RepID=UPI000BB75AF2|nr:hypothetical protein [Bacillus sp. FJAT-45350]